MFFTYNKILLIDLSNLFWLSRGKHTHESSLQGGWAIAGQFLMTFNSWLNIHNPTSVIFLDDGYPQWRYDAHKEYKAGRAEKREADPLTADFIRQKDDIKKLLETILPVYYFHVSYLEADDLSYLLCSYLKQHCPNADIIGISTDDDWRQLMCDFKMKVWNPMKKEFKEKPDFDFIKYKAVLGDKSDNILGFEGIGKVTALKLAKSQEDFDKWYEILPEPDRSRYSNNRFLIDFKNIPEPSFEYVYKLIEDFKLPKYLKSYLEIYCRDRKIFRFYNMVKYGKSHQIEKLKKIEKE